MNYKQVYEKLIEKAKNRILLNESVDGEMHHIIPKCVGGTNNKDNLVKLTYREHYIAHKLLCKIYDSHKLKTALWLMTNTTLHVLNNKNNVNFSHKKILNAINNGFKLTSYDYNYARSEYVKSIIGKKLTAEKKEKISKNTINGMKTSAAFSGCQRGRIKTKTYFNKITGEEFCWKSGDADIDPSIYEWGRPKMTQAQREKISNSFKNPNKKRFHSEEFKLYQYIDTAKFKIPETFKLGKIEYKNNSKFNDILRICKNELIQKYNISVLHIWYEKCGKKFCLNPGFFEIYKSIIKHWYNNKNIIIDIIQYTINNIEYIKNKFKNYFLK
jgi:hypothetical protein